VILRSLAIAIGALILTAVTHMTVVATGGYGSPHAYLAIAIAAGVAVGSILSGVAWSSERRSLAVFLALTILAGEAYNFVSTAERIIVTREAAQAPLREAGEAQAKAKRRVDLAEQAERAAPASSPRLQDALEAKRRADTDAAAKSTERGCRENCRQLLQAQVDSAEREVGAAREAIEQKRADAERELATARAALAAVAAPASPSPLADRLGMPAWIVDLVQSALGSLAANGLACCLLIFGAHGSTTRVEVVNAQPTEPLKPAAASPTEHAARFAFECIEPGGQADLKEVAQRYRAWVAAAGDKHLEPDELADATSKLFERAGVRIVIRAGRLVALGVTLKPQSRQVAVTPVAASQQSFGGFQGGTATVDNAVDAPPKRLIKSIKSRSCGGEGGIRTRDTLASMPHFECGAFNHSATSPGCRALAGGL
jgi:hypothetical protein